MINLLRGWFWKLINSTFTVNIFTMIRIQKINYLWGILCGIVILVLSLFPSDFHETQSLLHIPEIDKIVHSIMYMAFSFLLLLGHRKKNNGRLPHALLIMSLMLVYSIMIELIQEYFIPFRGGEYLDVLANLCGIVAGWLLLKLKKVRS